MPSLITNFWNSTKRRQLTEVHNLTLYIFLVIVLAITWSGIKTVQTNYELQKQINTLQQQNAVLELENQNTALQNQYYQTNQYLELAARQYFGLAAPGEKVLLISKDVAMKYIDPNLGTKTANQAASDNRSKYIKNFDAWRDFLLGRRVTVD